MSNLYNRIKANLAEIKADTTITAEVLSEPAVNQLYQQIVPIKPNILAEERIFVYVPKVTIDQAGIAKFSSDQFNIIGGQVFIQDEYLLNAILTQFMKATSIYVNKYEPTETEDYISMWYKVLDEEVAPPTVYKVISGGLFTDSLSDILSGGEFNQVLTGTVQGGTF